MKLELIATATFGLEAIVRREVEALGYKILKTEDGRITYMGDERAIVRSNLWLRCADRVYIRMGEFHAKTFEELFQQTRGIAWEEIIPLGGKFPVVGTSVKSTLHSVPACQSIVKKAIVERLSDFYGRTHSASGSLPETGAEYKIRFAALKDNFVMMIDTSGVGLHKRGYRVKDVQAPIKETLAAALVDMSYYRKERILVDPCCGSGTIPIEAAMKERNIAPGLTRSFVSEEWDIIDSSIWKIERKEAYAAADFESELRILALDIDARAIAAARANAEEAGVLDDIEFRCQDMTKLQIAKSRSSEAMEALSPAMDDYVVVISNPPYGVRIGTTEDNRRIYRKLENIMTSAPRWSFFIITADQDFEAEVQRKADRRRKLYNGMIETQYYQFHGERPPKNQYT